MRSRCWKTAAISLACLAWACSDSTTSPSDAGTIEGAVRDDAGAVVPAVAVHLRNRGASTDLAVETGGATDGAFRFEGVEPGEYDVRIDVPPAFSLSGQANPVPATSRAGRTTTIEFTLELIESGLVTGSVIDTAGGPVEASVAELRVVGATAGFRTATTDATGDYRFDRVPTGDYDVFLSAPSGLAVTSENPARVSVSEGAAATANFVLALSTVSFSRDIQPVFDANCALSGCHGGVNPRPTGKGMSLEPGEAYANIVGVTAFQLPSMDRIEPGQPDNSYLIHKIQGTQAQVGGSGDKMPFGGIPLSPETIDMIRTWVSEGAPDN